MAGTPPHPKVTVSSGDSSDDSSDGSDSSAADADAPVSSPFILQADSPHSPSAQRPVATSCLCRVRSGCAWRSELCRCCRCCAVMRCAQSWSRSECEGCAGERERRRGRGVVVVGAQRVPSRPPPPSHLHHTALACTARSSPTNPSLALHHIPHTLVCSAYPSLAPGLHCLHCSSLTPSLRLLAPLSLAPLASFGSCPLR